MKVSKIPILCLSLMAASSLAGSAAQQAPRTNVHLEASTKAWTPAAVVANQNMAGKVMSGYQGWFNAPGDGSGFGWRHFGDTPGKVSFDMWPDMSEFGPDERYPTQFKHKDGSTAELFSSYNEKTVLRHFKWMRDYGLDGVFLQRFASQTKTTGDPRVRKHVDTILDHVRKGAREYGRVYGLMYDLSGVSDESMQGIIDDWKYLVDTTHLTKDERYVRNHGKPVVVLWGLGFSGNRHPLLEEGLRFVNFLKNDPVYGGNEVMIGVPSQWRTTDNATVPFAKMQALIEAADIVSPWMVGSMPNPDVVVQKYHDIVKPDMEWCKAHGKEYMPVVFPGFSWYNLRKGRTPSNQIPRLGGRFLWTQYLEAKKLGATMVYQAMFDEVDEGTAILKITNDPPDGDGKSQFVTYEGLPSDFYLKLVGQATRLIRGEIKPEDDQLVKNAKWTPFVPALPVIDTPVTPVAPAAPATPAAPAANVRPTADDQSVPRVQLAGFVSPQTRVQPMAAATAPSVDLALNKKYVSSNPNTQGWDHALTDGNWASGQSSTYATGYADAFPKTVTIDLEAPTSIGYVAVGVPNFGSTKTVNVSVGTDDQSFTDVGSNVFSQSKEEQHIYSFAAKTARYVRLTYADHYTDQVGFPPLYSFATEAGVYAPGPTPILPIAPPEYPDVAAPKRSGDGSINAGFLAMHESFLKRGKDGPIGVLFIGDSITHRWTNTNVKDIWDSHYGKYNPADFGIEGDRTQHVLWRFENGELDGIHPKVVVVMIGTNNMGYPADQIIKGDTKIVSEIHRRLPDTKVLLLGIFPRGAAPTDPSRAKIKGINAELAKLDDGSKTRFLDFGDKFLDADGNITKEMMPDSLHPTPIGYQLWADAMQPLLDSMMK